MTMSAREFKPGFRLSVTDVLVLVAGAVGAFFAAGIAPWAAAAIAFVVLHFFLFCNVLRMSRPLELVWAGVFLALAIAAIRLQVPAWPVVFAVSLAVTVVVAIVQLRLPSYHGVGWQRINPQLRQWWEASHREAR